MMTRCRLDAGLGGDRGQDFADKLVRALRALPAGSLPLTAACTQGGWVDDSDLAISVLTISGDDGAVSARVGVFFTEVVGGCNCNDDPVGCSAYGVVRVTLDRTTGIAEIVPDGD